MQISGHKNVQSVNSYSKLNEVQQKSISNILSNKERLLLPTGASKTQTHTTTSSTLLPSSSPPDQNESLDHTGNEGRFKQHDLSSFFTGNTINANTLTINIHHHHATSHLDGVQGGQSPIHAKGRRILPLADTDSQ